MRHTCRTKLPNFHDLNSHHRRMILMMTVMMIVMWSAVSINDNALPSVLIIRDTSDDFHCVMIVISGYSLYYRSVQESNTEGDLKEYRRLAGPRRRSLRHDKQQWAEHTVSYVVCNRQSYCLHWSTQRDCLHHSRLDASSHHSVHCRTAETRTTGRQCNQSTVYTRV